MHDRYKEKIPPFAPTPTGKNSASEFFPVGVRTKPDSEGIIDTDMLRSCFGSEAGHYPDADAWAKRAVAFFIQLGRKDNGRPLTVPG